MITGLNTNTEQNLQLGAGAILKTKYTAGTTLTADNILTATNGGITFTATPSIFAPTVDGLKENTKGMKFSSGWVVTCTFTAVEASEEVIKRGLGFASVKDGVISGKDKIDTSDYQDLYIIGEKSNGDVIQITIKNALSTGGFSLTTTNNGNGGIAFTVNGHYDLNKQDEAPFEIETIAKAQ